MVLSCFVKELSYRDGCGSSKVPLRTNQVPEENSTTGWNQVRRRVEMRQSRESYTHQTLQHSMDKRVMYQLAAAAVPAGTPTKRRNFLSKRHLAFYRLHAHPTNDSMLQFTATPAYRTRFEYSARLCPLPEIGRSHFCVQFLAKRAIKSTP